MSSYNEGGLHGRGGMPIKGNPRRDSDAAGRPSSLVGSHDESFNATDELKRLELQEDIKKQQQTGSVPVVVHGSGAKNVVTGFSPRIAPSSQSFAGKGTGLPPPAPGARKLSIDAGKGPLESASKTQRTPPLAPAADAGAACPPPVQLHPSAATASFAPVRASSAPSASSVDACAAASTERNHAGKPLAEMTKEERAEFYKNKLSAEGVPPKEKKPQQKKSAAGDAAAPSSDAVSSGAADTPSAAKPKVTGKPSTGSLAGKLQADDARAVRTAAKKSLVKREEAFRKITWLAHLPQYASKRYTNWSPSLQTGFGGVGKDFLHPAVLQLGLRYAEGSIVGGTNRTLALMATLKTVIEQLAEDGSDMQLRTLLRQVVDKNVQFLVTCRPLAVGMGNAIREFKNEIERFHKTTPNATFEFAKSYFKNICSSYMKEKCSLAVDAIIPLACDKIKDGDVIVTYGFSSIIQQTFLFAAEKLNKKFRVVVVDSFPRFEGRKLLESLSASGIPCTYLLINAAAYMMREASKVMIGAAGVRANGNVSSRCGTASVCMMAHYYRVPVMVLCQTFKFTESVLLDSFCDNEIGDPEDVVAVSTPGMRSLLADWRNTKSNLNVLNLMYDTTPMRYVTVIVTELGLIPPSSVPVVVRENDLLNNADMYM